LLRTRSASPALDAALLLGDILHAGRTELLVKSGDPLPAGAEARYQLSLEKRLSGQSVAYIRGRKEFRGLDFIVTPAVLVPRPDTETLVEAALETLARIAPLPGPLVLDLCTGSGAVAVALKHERPDLRVYAADISAPALEIARLNAAKLLPPAVAAADAVAIAGAVAKDDPALTFIEFIESDLFENIPRPPPGFTLITANPPYVPRGLIDTLAPEVRREPRLALDGGETGLDLIRRIIDGAPSFLRPGGALLLEADPSQFSAIDAILRSRGYGTIQRYHDLSGRPRVAAGSYPGGAGPAGEAPA
jgi:release factor glutamine methyltransferase